MKKPRPNSIYFILLDQEGAANSLEISMIRSNPNLQLSHLTRTISKASDQFELMISR
jgi:hypothetical protein